ncbi:DUF3159 domain-containing protein [Actinoplanes sp. TBRC 11911]|uniref:DUF3159 domain-containing protein n=1 Tax=Actinoplanes sp. TBRC 11911 TaxID=2729386 RepID=UPI00289D78EE|nr:DUF3159 domain-containing protein [Actinoplanes sp. TBRC 11911]
MTPGSEPVEERLAEEVVEGLDLQPEEEPLPSMSELLADQLGGVRGLIESSLPVLAFVVLNVVLGNAVVGLEKQTALTWAIIGAVLSALGIGAYRLARKQPVRHAVNGLLGIAVGAFLAWRTGRAQDFYLPGILLTFGQAAVLLISVMVRKPIIGYAWGILANKGRHDWFANPRLFRTFQWLTLVWVASLGVRAGIQYYLWALGEANALGVVRILISWPIYAATFAFTAWAIHRVTSAPEKALT